MKKIKKLELFTVYAVEGNRISVEVNAELLEACGVSVDELNEQFEKHKMNNVVKDFLNIILKEGEETNEDKSSR